VVRLPILVYHKVDRIPSGARYPKNYVLPEQFDAQLAHLKHWGYRSISIADYLAYRRGEGQLPRRPVIITFDDGYRSTGELAASLLKKHGFRATIFLVSELVGGTNTWDPDEIQEPLLGPREIRMLLRDGFTFGSHTRSHVHLPTLSAAAAAEELRDSKAALERLLGHSVTALAYPYAKHTEEIRRLAREAGYLAAVGIHRRLNRDDTDLYALRRIPVSFRTSLRRLQWDLFRLRWARE
jgi:peptidoglycan/xylan/chitin deacetylase (PgdA/CDA1 family)